MFVQPIDEAYFGKTKEILDIEYAIRDIRNKFKFKKDGYTEENLKKVLDSKLYEKFTTAIKKAFGFKEVYGGFDTDQYMNCYTYPIREEKYGLMQDRFEVKGKSIKFKPELKAVTMIVATAPLFFTDKLTNAELTAIFLHEIGHSFKQAVIPVETCLDVLRDSLGSVIFNFLSATKHTMKELEKNPFDAITNLGAIIKASPEAKERTRKRWPSLFEKVLRGFKNTSSGSVYIDEKFADQFAAMFGYGVELNSALVKIDYDRKDIKGAPVLNFLNTFAGLIDLSLDLMLDCHPFIGARLKSTVNVLQREIDKNSTLPDSEKKRLKKQIDSINLLALQYQNLDKSSNYSMAKKMYFQFIYNNLKDGDVFSKFLVGAYNLELVDQKIRDATK